MSLVNFPHLTLAQCAHLQTLQTQLDDAHALILAAIHNQDPETMEKGFVARCAIVDEQLKLVCGRSLRFQHRL